jgi:hypothetical protein
MNINVGAKIRNFLKMQIITIFLCFCINLHVKHMIVETLNGDKALYNGLKTKGFNMVISTAELNRLDLY